MKRSRTFKTLLLSTGQVIATLATVLVFSILSRVLSVRDYGTYMQAMLIYSTALPLMTLGLPEAPYYFLPRQKDRTRATMYENLLLLTFMGCIFSIAILAGGSRIIAGFFDNPDLERALRYIAPYPIFMLPVLSLPACLMAQERVMPIPIFSVVTKVLMLGLVLGSCLVWGTVWAALIALVVSAAVVFVPGIILMLQSCTSKIRRPNWTSAREQLFYSVPLGAAGLVGILSLKLNQIVVSTICTTEEFAIYVNGAIEIPIVGVIMASVRSVLLADFVKMYDQGEARKIGALWSRATISASAILIPVMVFSEVLAPEAIRLLFSAKYESAVVPFRILLLLLVMRSISLNSIFLATGHSKLVLQRGAVSLLLNAILSWVLVHYFGYIGASVALVAVMYLWATPYTFFKTSRILDLRLREVYPFQTVGKILAASLLASSVLFLKNWMGHWPDYFVLGLSIGLYFPLVFVMYRVMQISGVPNGRNLFKGIIFKSG